MSLLGDEMVADHNKRWHQQEQERAWREAEEARQQVVAGVGVNAPTVVNREGGKQSKVLYRFDLLDPKAMFEMTRVLEVGGRKYGEDNWRLIDVQDHLNHLIIHAYAYLAGDESDEHLSHIMCRAMFAQACVLQTPDQIEQTKKRLGMG